MATHWPGLDPRAVIEGRPPGRPRAGFIVSICAAVGCAVLAFGADALESVGSSQHSVVPFLIALPLALFPVPVLIALVLLLDRLEPEPRRNLVFAFAWGAGVAALLAAVINTAGLVLVTEPDLGAKNGEYISATFGAPVVEETLKGLVLMGMLWRRRAELDGPTDGIIYAAMVGLGFAMTENIGYYVNAMIRPGTGGAELLGVTFVFRGLLAPFAHPAFTAMTGIGVAYAATRRQAGWAALAGLLAAMFLHGLWNGLTIAGIGGIAVGYCALACVLGGLVAVVVAERRRVVRLIWRFLPGYAPAGVVAEADLRMLSTLRGRRDARRWARLSGGAPAASAMADYQLAATELALLHQRAERRVVDQDRFRERQAALVALMASARQTFFRHHPAPPAPPWSGGGASGFAHPPRT